MGDFERVPADFDHPHVGIRHSCPHVIVAQHGPFALLAWRRCDRTRARVICQPRHSVGADHRLGHHHQVPGTTWAEGGDGSASPRFRARCESISWYWSSSPFMPLTSGEWAKENAPANITSRERASSGPQAPLVRSESTKRPTPIKMLASGSTSTRVDCEATIGPAWKAFWAMKTPRTPKQISP